MNMMRADTNYLIELCSGKNKTEILIILDSEEGRMHGLSNTAAKDNGIDIAAYSTELKRIKRIVRDGHYAPNDRILKLYEPVLKNLVVIGELEKAVLDSILKI